MSIHHNYNPPFNDLLQTQQVKQALQSRQTNIVTTFVKKGSPPEFPALSVRPRESLPDCFIDGMASNSEPFYGFSAADVTAGIPVFDEAALTQFEDIFGEESEDNGPAFVGFAKDDMCVFKIDIPYIHTPITL